MQKWHYAAVLLAGLLAMPADAQALQEGKTRKAAVAGQFYPADPVRLKSEIAGYIERVAAGEIPGEIAGISVPHAGYEYSAQTAAAAYKAAARQNYDLIVVLAPSHRDYFSGGAIYPGEAYETPLGQMKIDRETAAQLAHACNLFAISGQGHGAEHSLEVQVPFLQTLFPGSRLLPIVIGDYNWQSCEKMGLALARVLKGKRVLVVASTDLYHGESYEECQKSDAATLLAVMEMNPRALCEGLQRQSFQACGGGPLVVLQVALKQRGACKGKIVARTNSNDVTHQRGGYVVGYAAAVYYLPEASMIKKTFAPLPRAAQIELLHMARESIKHYLKNKTIPSFQSKLDILQEKRGVFVTITINGALRGCIGMHEADRPLLEVVPDRAIAAAFEDPRFMPLRLEELDKIKIKVSVYLSNVYAAASLDDFIMGKHGIILMKGSRGATYLPEVPLEAGWKTKEEEMASLCQKAGLKSDAWREGAQIFLYETQVFDESLLAQ